MSKRLRSVLLMLPLWLSGCVVFERAPAPRACDARLAGRWLPIANTPEEAAKQTAEDYALVDAQCHAMVSMSQIGSSPASKAKIEVSGFELGGEHYFVLTEGSVAQLFAQASASLAQENKLPSTAVTLVRYRIEGNVLTLATVDPDTVKKMSGQRRLNATPLDQFNYLIPGDEATLRDVLLAHPELFEKSNSPPMRMKRAAGAPSP
jgi:hypothetical protein